MSTRSSDRPLVPTLNGRDSHARSIAKAITYRIIGLGTTLGIAWVMTGHLGAAAAIGVVDSVVKLGLFYGHERVWDHVEFGRPKRPDYMI